MDRDRVNKNRMKRREKLVKLLELLYNYGMDAVETNEDELFQINRVPRKEYISPKDRSGYNYRYMTIGEIGAGTPNVW